MIGKISSLRGQRGFSMAELVIAFVLLTCSVLGVTFMITSGHTNIIRGAKELAASNLASKKIEEIKSLPFYKSYNGTVADISDPTKNKDIDDFYWAYNGNPTVEDYGTIKGGTYSSYKRETAIKYEYVAGGMLAEATMDPNWVPKGITGSQTDVPTGGAAGGPYTQLHAILIQVKVYYMQDGLEKSYTAQGLAGDLMITGGTNSPPLVINSISPGFAALGTASQPMTIYVTSQGLNETQNLNVYLWYADETDVQCMGGVAHANPAGTQITCNFDLRADNNVRVGFYNIAVYWPAEGWKAVYRDNTFLVKQPDTDFVSLSSYKWGYKGQNGRQVTLTGAGMFGATVTLKGPTTGPNANAYTISGTTPVVSSDGTTLTTTFGLLGDSATEPDSYWNFEITGPGALTPGPGNSTDSDTNNSRRFYLNPRPVIDKVVKIDQSTYATDYANQAWTYRQKASPYNYIRVEGQYLYGQAGPVGSSYLEYNSYQTNAATAFSSTPVLTCDVNDSIIVRYNTGSSSADIGAYNSACDNKNWQVCLTNSGGTAYSDTGYSDWTKTVLMNPPPTGITETLPGTLTTGSAAKIGGTKSASSPWTYSGLSVSGGYFQEGAKIYFVKSNSNPPATNSPNVTFEGLGSITGDGASGMSFGSALTLNVTVGGSTSTNFYQYPSTSTKAENENMTDSVNGGTAAYYVVVKNADGQCAAASSRLLSHVQTNFPVSSKQPTWGSASSVGGGTWQDETAPGGSATFTAVPTASPANVYTFVQWQKNDVDVSDSPSYSTTVLSTDVVQARFRLTVYGDGGYNPGGFSKTSGNKGSVETAKAFDGFTTLYVKQENGASSGGSCTAGTSSSYDFTGATNAYIYWRQTQNGGGDNKWSFRLDTSSTGNWDSGSDLKSHNNTPNSWESLTIPITGSTYTGHYVHVGAWASWVGANNYLYVRYLYFE